jgi:thiol:disulfide interchange protein
MEFYSTIKKNEILPSAGKWMELVNIILSSPGSED